RFDPCAPAHSTYLLLQYVWPPSPSSLLIGELPHSAKALPPKLGICQHWHGPAVVPLREGVVHYHRMTGSRTPGYPAARRRTIGRARWACLGGVGCMGIPPCGC